METVVETSVVPAEIVQTINVTAYVPKYTICGDDIFISTYTSAPPQWMTDLINYQIETSTLANDVDDLGSQFTNFKDGYTQTIGYLNSQDDKLAFDISTLKVSNDTNTAGIQRLDTVKVTADDAVAISRTTIAAWQNSGDGGAWFDSKVSAVSNVAYSAARSSANLTAVMNSQRVYLDAIAGDISILQKQVDGKVESWFSLVKPINVDGSVNVAVEPYATWLATGELAVHTGDTYIWYELDVNGNKIILGTYSFIYDIDTDKYLWSVVSDSIATEAYNRALQAQDTADGKIVTFYQTFPPVATISSLGDLWLDSDDSNKMYRYNGTAWVLVTDARISASVTRLDEATVTVDGKAKAKSSLVVDANGSISGYTASSGTTSLFKIYADKFTIARSDGQTVGAPFEIDTVNNKIKFTGAVTFAGTAVDTALQPGQAALDVNSGVTTINGGKITTNTLNANVIKANGNISSPNIYGGYISGTVIEGVYINGSIIKGSFIDMTTSNYLTNWQFVTDINTIPIQYRPNFATDPATGAYMKDSSGYYRILGTLGLSSPRYSNIAGSTATTSTTYNFDSYTIPIFPYDSYTQNSKARTITKDFQLELIEAETYVGFEQLAMGGYNCLNEMYTSISIFGTSYEFYGKVGTGSSHDAGYIVGAWVKINGVVQAWTGTAWGVQYALTTSFSGIPYSIAFSVQSFGFGPTAAVSLKVTFGNRLSWNVVGFTGTNTVFKYISGYSKNYYSAYANVNLTRTMKIPLLKIY